LSPPQIFYQRMLADDPAEALDKAEQFLNERPLSAYYDEVALQGLKLAQIDLDSGALDALHLQRIRDSAIELVKELDDHEDQKRQEAAASDTEEAPTPESASNALSFDLPRLVNDDLALDWRGDTPVLCIAGRSGLDEAAASMLAQLLSKHGLGARVKGADALSAANILDLDKQGVAMACVSFVNSNSPAQMRYTIRRLRRKLPQAKIILGCWMAETDTNALADAVKADAIAVTLRDAVRLCLEQARGLPLNDAIETRTLKIAASVS